MWVGRCPYLPLVRYYVASLGDVHALLGPALAWRGTHRYLAGPFFELLTLDLKIELRLQLTDNYCWWFYLLDIIFKMLCVSCSEFDCLVWITMLVSLGHDDVTAHTGELAHGGNTTPTLL